MHPWGVRDEFLNSTESLSFGIVSELNQNCSTPVALVLVMCRVAVGLSPEAWILERSNGCNLCCGGNPPLLLDATSC